MMGARSADPFVGFWCIDECIARVPEKPDRLPYQAKTTQEWELATNRGMHGNVGIEKNRNGAAFFGCMSHRLHLGPASFSLALPPVAERPLTPSPLPSPTKSSSSTFSGDVLGSLQKAKDDLQKAVSKRGTKASSISIDKDVKEVCYQYKLLGVSEREEFLLHVSKSLATNHESVTELIKQMPQFEIKSDGIQDNNNDVEALMRWEDKLRQILQPPYYWLATQISRLNGGVKFLVDIREDILNLLGTQNIERESQTELKTFDANLRDLLSLWFTVGLLELQRITWESPCELLQKISEYEAVHPVRNWTDLKKRVGNYRRCFIFTHACMPNEPLVVLHTFLTTEISKSMSKIVQSQRYMSFDESSMKIGEDSSTITTAIFYSITSTQKGLKGIELGNYLIKRVVKELQADIPHLSQFSSLSPIPGFVKWLQSNLVRAQRGDLVLFTSSEMKDLKAEMGTSDDTETYLELRSLFKTNGWSREDNLPDILEKPLMRLCAFYLFSEKRRGYALDPVANFHLKNGAVMWRINWNADRSPRGMDNSCGIMVNYRYFLEDCETNSKNYSENGSIIASENIVYLAKLAKNLTKDNNVH
ncbi:Malonyl-CoA decarboxylase, mitochondrial [Armadillidium vulgare]|nr:Malonyl-CoA decarboxylase, mitochondrial [Armadillidium vulgare]